MKLFLATGNQHKIKEMRQILADTPFEIVAPADIAEQLPDVEEDKDTFSGNALKKARTIAKYVNLATIADDSGLEVDALAGRPGVYSARYAGLNATDQENNQKLLTEMATKENRGARFICAMAFVSKTGQEKVVIGKCEGEIASQLAGNEGFGYDPLFIPKGYQQSFAQLGAKEKNKISHRTKALEKMKDFLLKTE